MRAFDPIWTPGADGDCLVPLREHVIRLCFAADELHARSGQTGWAAISTNLHMAASITDLNADTDLRGNSFMCSSAADYDEALSEITRKHLAGVIVFNLCWTAYEGAVEIASAPYSLRQPKGARGRTLLLEHVPASHFPYLHQCLNTSLRLIETTQSELAELCRLLFAGEKAAGAAELMRIFRNQVVHGSLGRPEPTGWRLDHDYNSSSDPYISRFGHHIRLVVMLTQILMSEAVDVDEEISCWSNVSPGSGKDFGVDLRPASDVLRTLHYNLTPLPLFD